MIVSDLKMSKSLFLKIEEIVFLRKARKSENSNLELFAKRFELTELESIVTQLQMRFSFLVLKILTELARDFRSFVDAFGQRQYRGSVFGVLEKYVEVWNKFIRLDIGVGYLSTEFLLSDIIYQII